MTTHHGTAVNKIHGRNLPQRVSVRSARTPTIGSATASHSRGQSRIAAAALARQAENVRVKIRLEQNHRHEDEIRGGIGGAVTGLFEERKFLLEMCSAMMFWVDLFRHRQNHFLQIARRARNCRP